MGYAAVTLPRVVTVLPTSGLAVPSPWIWSMALIAGGVTGAGSGSGAGAGVPAAVGVMVALSVKSVELLLLSAPLLRFRLLTSALPDGALAAWVSKVLEVP